MSELSRKQMLQFVADICNGNPDDSSIKYDTSTWQKEMDENGYGAYGSGLRIGRSLALGDFSEC